MGLDWQHIEKNIFQHQARLNLEPTREEKPGPEKQLEKVSWDRTQGNKNIVEGNREVHPTPNQLEEVDGWPVLLKEPKSLS